MKREDAPKIDSNAWYSIGEAARLLGIDRSTMLRKAKLGRRRGGLDFKTGLNGRKKFSGREIQRFYDKM